ncbi:ArsR/SmtB family transcription factor [Enterovirga aerilata]|uniref:ArsR/SmtB family transcription factor n=1 Tax=Enterovirga aerilata TaxID=2730920 RepID=UPI001AEF0F7D|nr:ArsR family transcriptional regulator [Enterovirga sp. DB1703]
MGGGRFRAFSAGSEGGPGPKPLPAERLGVSSSNLSFHLKDLEHSGLVQSRRASRSIIYSANLPALSGLVAFLMRDCCSGHPEICAPAVAALTDCCSPAKELADA